MAYAALFFSDMNSEKSEKHLSEWCVNNAPCFAVSINGTSAYRIIQGCCNSWTCPRCGQMRAKKEYGRIVEGMRTLAKEHDDLYFITLTCRGSGLPVKVADENYLLWTNRLLSTWRANARKRNLAWVYVQVTERQKRGHPHSHVLSTWYPDDMRNGTRRKYYVDNAGDKRWRLDPVLLSDYMRKSITRVGLGEQYDISVIDTVEGASRYVAKYLFKDTMFSDHWAKNWRRIRYSQSFPKLPEKPNTDAIVLLSVHDWRELDRKATHYIPDSEQAEYVARRMLNAETRGEHRKRIREYTRENDVNVNIDAG